MGNVCEKGLEDELKRHGESQEDVVARDPDEPWATAKPTDGRFVGFAWTSKRVYFATRSLEATNIGSVARNPPARPPQKPDSGPREPKRKRADDANKSTF